MPPAVAMAIPAVAGAGASASGGKKNRGSANKAAERQFQLQQDVLNFGKSLVNTGLGAWTPAASYWQSLLSGDPTKIAEATGPTADIIRQQSQATGRELAARMPMGGEAIAAQGANALQTSNNLARLYAGVQPTAATALGQISGIPFGAGTSTMGQGAPNVGSGLKFQTHANDQLSQAKGGLGTGLGQMIAGRKQGKNTGGGGSTSTSSGGGSIPPWIGV